MKRRFIEKDTIYREAASHNNTIPAKWFYSFSQRAFRVFIITSHPFRRHEHEHSIVLQQPMQ
ncbi:uncharacterized protein BYT42DRAFT_633812 [Radiomyces spectabilis]|uniref:uncharacterized protein n=1 Tax=Radiomyces spectabilis TaxID=64574 RepID=UPI002220C4C5|nr:uncharacterized protein BYT42DRAFT_633812 [Radiomyces spectabilis]KAI8385001.1 hypothetical protein BYT42DRAFT_633812 [Radiomyces spectabilis]